jgi:hypothetical protein
MVNEPSLERNPWAAICKTTTCKLLTISIWVTSLTKRDNPGWYSPKTTYKLLTIGIWVARLTESDNPRLVLTKKYLQTPYDGYLESKAYQER